MKKIIWFLAGMMFATSVSAFALSYVEYFFNDEESFNGAWYHESAMSMLDRQIIQGDDDNNFNPNNVVNRAEMAVMLDRTIDYVWGTRDNAIESNNASLLASMQSVGLLNDATDEEIAFVRVSLGENELDYDSYWWTYNNDEYLNELIDGGCEESDLILNEDSLDGYAVYYCEDYFYIYDEVNDVIYGTF